MLSPLRIRRVGYFVSTPITEYQQPPIPSAQCTEHRRSQGHF